MSTPIHASVGMVRDIDVRYEPPRCAEDHTASISIVADSHLGMVLATLQNPDDAEALGRRLLSMADRWRADRGEVLHPWSAARNANIFDPPTERELPIVAGPYSQMVLAAAKTEAASA
jgi:hypothetical protein